MVPKDVMAVLRDNVKLLLHARGWSQVELARRSGIAQRTISDVLGYGIRIDKAPTLRTVAAIAKAFGVPPWQLMIELPIDLLRSHRVSRLVEQFAAVEEPGRESLERIAAAEVRIQGGVQPPSADASSDAA